MYYLIDGYNLLHALGIISPKLNGQVTLDLARRQLLEMVYRAHRQEPAQVTVVFDAAHGARKPSETTYKGVHVSFAVNYHQADDLIELLIKRAPHPRELTVISNDHRIQNAAERKGCQVMDCGRYMDLLSGMKPAEKTSTNGRPTKPESLSDAEKAHWLQEFAELDDDPALKELSEPHEFFEE